MRKKILTVFLIAQLYTNYVLADCEKIAHPPALLSKKSVNMEQLGLLGTQVEAYFSDIERYKACIDEKLALIDPDVSEYQLAYEDWQRLTNMADEKKTMAIERFNMYIELVGHKKQ